MQALKVRVAESARLKVENIMWECISVIDLNCYIIMWKTTAGIQCNTCKVIFIFIVEKCEQNGLAYSSNGCDCHLVSDGP